MSDRLRLIAGHGGIDAVVVLKTSAQLLDLAAPAFWNDLLCSQLQMQGLVEGRNFCFGKNRIGNVSLLALWAKEKRITFEVVDDIFYHGVQVSSTMIRLAIKRGDVESAREGLGRSYSITGTVVHGQHRGQKLGFPTCNLASVRTLIPLDGVYAALAYVNEQPLVAAVHVGANSTFGETARTVEAHLLDFSGDLYGRTIRVDFLARLRDSVRYDSIDELQKQLQLDVEQTRRVGKQKVN